MATLSILWVLSHEVGHYLTGHLGFYSNQLGLLKVSETHLENSFSTIRSFRGLSNQDQVIMKRACELMADSYATIRLFLILINDTVDKHTIDAFAVIRDACKGAAYPGLIFLMKYHKYDSNPLALERTYPTELCRIFNILATSHFCVFPKNNATMDLRPSPTIVFLHKNIPYDAGWEKVFETTIIFMDIRVVPVDKLLILRYFQVS